MIEAVYVVTAEPYHENGWVAAVFATSDEAFAWANTRPTAGPAAQEGYTVDECVVGTEEVKTLGYVSRAEIPPDAY